MKLAKRALAILTMTLLAGLLAPAQEARSAEAGEVAEYREKIFLSNLGVQLRYRRSAMIACARRTRNPSAIDYLRRLEDSLGSIQTETGELSSSHAPCPDPLPNHTGLARFAHSVLGAATAGRTRYSHLVSEALTLVRETRTSDLASACEKELKDQDARLRADERKSFSKLSWIPLVRELDPQCALRSDRNLDPNGRGYLDTNPCYAGTNLVMKDLLRGGPLSGGADSERRVQEFVWNAGRAVAEQARPGNTRKTIDVSRVFHDTLGIRSDRESNKVLLAYLAYLHTETSWSGFMNPYDQAIWKRNLTEGRSTEEVLDRYNAQKRIRDYHRNLRVHAEANGVRLRLAGQDLQGFNRHDFMAAYLACHYEDRWGEKAGRLIPLALGSAYEAKDLISHMLDDGDGIRQSLRSFEQDTERYRRGTELGLRLCR